MYHGKKALCHNSSRHECLCNNTPKEPLVGTSGCSDDLAAVLALPDCWTPRRSGPILKNYLEERKCRHEQFLKELLEKAAKVNENIDAKVRDLAEVLLVHIKENQNNLDCIINQFKPTDNTLIDDRNVALKLITDLHTQTIEDLLKFKDEAHGLERQRADDLRSLLQCEFQRLVAVGQLSPKELLHDFDGRIYEINQQLISNCRAYIDLEAHLRAQLDDKVVQVRSSLNQVCANPSIVLRRHSDRKANFNRKRSLSLDSKEDSRPGRLSCHRVTIDLEEFEKCVLTLVEAYRSATLDVFSHFTGRLLDLKKNIGKIRVSDVNDDLRIDVRNMTDRALQQINDDTFKDKNLVKELVEMTRLDIRNMQTGLSTLGERLRSTYNLLHDASLLWNPHIFRCALAQKLTVTAVEDMITNFDISELSNEIFINIALEQMRGAPDVDKTQQQYDCIMNLLERTKETYLQHTEAEIVKLEEFMNLEQQMTTLLLSEYHCFLENNPLLSRQIIESKTSLASYSSIATQGVISLHAPLPRALLQTKLQDVALTNWRNGFLEAFSNNMSDLPAELSKQMRIWVDEKNLLLNMRHSLKFMSQSVRAERIEAARDIRLAELRLHDKRLASHLDALYQLIDSHPTNASEFLALDSPDLYPLCDWIKDIQKKIDDLLSIDPLDPDVKRLKMTSYAARILKHRQLYEVSLDTAIDQYKTELEIRFQEARISNIQFMSQIVLFNEGGRYAAPEALKTCTALVRGADSLESCFHRTFDILHHRRSHLLTMADHLIQPLQKIVEEVVKNTGKGQQVDKKKAAAANKKK